jgi:calcineurin-like phosphoesterase family protein
MTVFFTADTHFDDPGIVYTCKRPFKDVAEMNKGLIERWNSKVGKQDTIYHLGDFGLGRESFLKKLNGKIILVKGNHDENLENEINFITIKYKDELFDLMHDPVLSIIGKSHCVLHGHVHDMWKWIYTLNGKFLINVGVDVWNYTPVSIDEIIGLGRPAYH